MEIQRLSADEWQRLERLRLAALRDAPEALIDTLIDWARSAGFSRLVLDVADDNAAAVALYARHGFEPTGEVGCLPPTRTHIREHRRALIL